MEEIRWNLMASWSTEQGPQSAEALAASVIGCRINIGTLEIFSASLAKANHIPLWESRAKAAFGRFVRVYWYILC